MLSLHITQNAGASLLDKDSLGSSKHQSRKLEDKEAYDPFQTPPDFQMAINHGKAKKVYKPQAHVISKSITKRVCPCCGLPIHGEQIPLEAKLNDLYHLGSGYALYFKLTKYCIVLLGIILIISGLFNLVTNKAENNCAPEDTQDSSSYCIQSFIISYTIANKRNNSYFFNIQMVLNLFTVIALFAFAQYMRYASAKTTIEIEHNVLTPADYTIQVTGIPPNTKDEEIKEWIESLGGSKHRIKCKKINRAYDIRDYIKLYQDKDGLISKFNLEHDHITRYMVEEEIQEVDKKIKNLKEKDLKLTNRVFISFEKPEDARFLINKSHGGILSHWLTALKKHFVSEPNKFDGTGATISKAPEPTDIIWENQGVSQRENFKRRLASDIWGATLITICFILLVLISFGQSKAIKHWGKQSQSIIRLLSGISSILVITITTIIARATIYLSRREKHSTYTSYFTGVTKRLCVAMFINTAFTTIFAKLVSVAFHADGDDTSDEFNFYRSGGLLENIFYVFISNATLTPLYNLLDPFHFIKAYKRKKARELGEGNPITQQKAHELFEEVEMDLSYQNSFLVKTVLVSAFFAPAVPFALIISILGLILNYWVDKYLLLRRNSLPISLGNDLNTYMLSVLEWTSCAFSIGNLLFILTLEDSSHLSVFSNVSKIIVLLAIFLSLLHTFFPMDFFSSKLLRNQQASMDNKLYDDSRVQFPTDYDIENPVTSREGIRNFIEFIKSKHAPSEELMKSSLKKGAFNMLRSHNLKDLVKQKGLSESAELKKENDLTFLQGYASKVFKGGVNLSKQKFEKEKNVHMDELFGITEEDLLNFDNPGAPTDDIN